MSHNKIIYQNTIPPIQPDCLLPKFKIPSFSPRFPQDSSLNKFPHEFRTDSLLGVKVPLCDLSVYTNCAPENLDADDFKYYTQLDDKTNKSMLSMPKQTAPRQPQHYAQRAQQKKIQEQPEATLYLKSKNFYSQTDDPEIREQLEHAFHGKIPEGEVHLIKPQKPLTTLINRQSAKPISKDSFVLISKGRKFLKVHDFPIEDDTPRRADKAFSIIEKDYDPNQPDKIFMFMDDQGVYRLGKLRKALILSQIAATDMKRERMIATPIIFENFQSEEKRHKKSGSDQEETLERPVQHSSNASSMSSSRSAASSVSSSASSRSNSSNSENENAGENEKETVERASLSSESSEHERKVDRRSSSSSDSEKQSPRENIDNDRRDDSKNSSRNSSSNENKQSSSTETNSENEQKQENRQSSHSNSENEVNRQSSRSNSENEANRQSSRSNSENEVNRQSSRSNSENEQKDDQSQNSSRNSSSDGDNDKKSYSSSDSDKNSPSSSASSAQSSRQNSASSDSDNN